MTIDNTRWVERFGVLLWILGGSVALLGLANVMPGYQMLPRIGPFSLEWFRPTFFAFCVTIAIVYCWRERLASGLSLSALRIAGDLVLWGAVLYSCYRYYEVGMEMLYSIVFFGLQDAVIAIVGVAVAIITCWRLWGAPIAIIGILAFLYLATGHYWPGALQISGGDILDKLAENLWFGADNGVLGSIFGIILSTVLPFIILGAVLDGCGAGGSMIRISFSLMRGFRGGPAYSAILASGMFGTVSGSAVANVVGTGVVTIPMIRRRGFSGNFAGGLEASASAGGQILPPIMGAAALVMADYVGVTYLTVITAVLIPAVAYYLSLFLAVYFEARKLGVAAHEDEIADPVELQDWLNLLLIVAPLGIIVFLLIGGASPAGASITAIFALIPLSLINPSIRRHPQRLAIALAEGGITVARLSMAIAVVGIIVATLSATGIPSKFAVLLSGASNYSLFAALAITALGCIVLGMGMPTLPAYIAIIVVMGPTLQAFGLELLTAHMFVFFFGIASVITPPVAIAAYAAAAISGGKPMATAVTSTRIAAMLFLIPFAFVYNPIMLTVGAAGADFSLAAYLWMIVQLALALYLTASALARFDRQRIALPEAGIRFATAVALLSPYPLVSVLGLVAGLGMIVLHARLPVKPGGCQAMQGA
ncbi:TRAP transporter permease [Halomonas salipaludis]|uniref:TRAP transporter permease DctM/Q n=1 Tax=Halomonas salipaludis TaxID=2032625 RepID=A0A2A2ER02_9GAMM|nr:TRAP transporter fused permease subunit [Halomonas salipaludis]PAU74825.1 TRAP transporter permease DctM/Q [Halomonas salipaludis]